MAYPNDAEVQRVASRCIALFDAAPHARGSRHTQSRRFLDATWKGVGGSLSGGGDDDSDAGDVPLRPLVQRLASGDVTLLDLAMNDDTLASRSLLHWVSAFRLARISVGVRAANTIGTDTGTDARRGYLVCAQ